MRKRFLNVMIGIFCIALLAGCNEEAKLKKITPPEADKLARAFITALSKKNVDLAEKLIEPSIRSEAKPKLKSLVELLSQGEIQEVKLIGLRGQKKDDQRMVQFNYQIYYAKAWVLATIAIIESPKDRYVISVRMDPLKQSLEKRFAFHLFGKSLVHYVVLLFAILIPLFMIYVAAQCVRVIQGKIKWLWLPFILIGFLSLQLDWESSRAILQPISILFLGVFFTKQKYGPLFVSVSVPIGALVFFFLHILKWPQKRTRPF